MAQYAIIAVIVLSIILVSLILLRPSVTTAQGGKMLAFIAFFILPIVATVFGASIHLENSKSTQFCLSCHVMEPYGKSLYRDDPAYLPAAHFQNHRIPKESACFSCHTHYTMFGDLTSKMRGLKHIYMYYLATPPPKLTLYEPFQNRECLYCHAGARSFEETTPHNAMQQQLADNSMSCITCHNKIHDVANLDKAKPWKGPAT